jgi:hypothetical protein
MLRYLSTLLVLLAFADLSKAATYNCAGAFATQSGKDSFLLTLDLAANGDITRLHAMAIEYGGKPNGDLGLGTDYRFLLAPVKHLSWDQSLRYAGKLYLRYPLPEQICTLFRLPMRANYYLYLPKVEASKGEVLDHGYINLRKPEPYARDYEVLLTIRPQS